MEKNDIISGPLHYVTPEIVLLLNKDTSKFNVDSVGYDGTKVDAWSTGVILCVVSFRLLPLVKIFFSVITINLSVSDMINIGKARMLVN